MIKKVSFLSLLSILVFYSCIGNDAEYTTRTIQSLEGNNILQFMEGEKVKLAGLPDNNDVKQYIRQFFKKKEEVTILWDSHFDSKGNMLAYIFTKDGLCLNSSAIRNGKIVADISYNYDSIDVYSLPLQNPPTNPSQVSSENGNTEKKLDELYEDLKKSVVIVYAKENSYFSQKFGLGSGFFIREDGIILSNHHVYASGMAGAIELENGKQYPIIQVLEDNTELDYVIFKIETNGDIFTPLRFIEHDSKKGESIFVIGHPKGMKFTITQGIISNIDQGSRPGDIMTDAAVNHGNSGGPMFNMKGEVIGLITYKRSDGCENCGFALDIRKVRVN